MAGVSGTEVLYKRESKLGLTTLTFRKRRYLFPNVAYQGEQHVLSASTGDLESRGRCVMLDVGLFCPHCAGAISAKLSGSHSKLIVSKALRGEHRCIKAGSLQAPIEDQPVTEDRRAVEHWCDHDDRSAPTRKLPAGLAEETRIDIGFGSLDRHRLTCRSSGRRAPAADKLSSSDYESLDRDAHINSWSSCDNSTAGTLDSVTCTGSLTAVPPRGDDAYCSMTSSQMSATHDSLRKMTNVGQKYSSLPRDVGVSTSTTAVSEEKLILDSMNVDTSDKDDDVLVDELLSDDVIDEEYQNLMNASAAAKETTTFDRNRNVSESRVTRYEVDRQNNNVPSSETFELDGADDGASERSASPETFVDDVLENIESEIFPGDATLPRVFALHREASARKHPARTKPDSRSARSGTENGDDQSKKNSSSLNRRELHELIKAVYLNSQKDRLSAQEDAEFSHEAFFEEVVEALTDLEGGFTTDWTSDYDSDNNKCASPSTPSSGRARFQLGDGPYSETVDGYRIQRKTTTSSCECIPDDRSRDLDSSTERISSAVQTPSELSVGSVEGYGSSSECSGSGHGESTSDDRRLFEQLIENTKSLTEDLLELRDERASSRSGSWQESDSHIHVIAPDKRSSPARDRSVQNDDVFTDGEHVTANSQSSSRSQVPVDVIRHVGPIPKIVESGDEFAQVQPELNTKTAVRRTIKSESSDDVEVDDDDDDDNLDVSLENLLVCNAVHCSTSDLDEPYSAELRYVSGLEVNTDTKQHDDESALFSELQKHHGKALTEVDEFVPETDEPQKEVIKQTLDTASSVSSFTDSGHPAAAKEKLDENKIIPRPKGTVTSVDSDGTSSTKGLISKDLMKYVHSQSCKTYHSKEHNVRLDSCLDDVCQTCSFQPKGPNEFIKNEEVTTQEVILEFVWPKKMKKLSLDRELAPKLPASKPSQPYRSVHLRRVMRVSDFDVDVVEGPTVETVEYRKDGSTRKSIVQRPSGKQQAAAIQKPEHEESTSESSQMKQSEVVMEQRFAEEHHQQQQQHSPGGATDEHRGSAEQTGGVTCDSSESDKRESSNGTISLAEMERLHYDKVSQSFVMPSMDMTASQKSEELYNLSSAASMELLSETEGRVGQLYSGHQQTVDAVFLQAESESSRDEDTADGVMSSVDTSETTRLDELRGNAEATSIGTKTELDEELDRDRESGTVEGKDPNLTLIDQRERNVYVVSVGKYFAGRADGQLDTIPDAWPASSEILGSESREATCPRCENVIVVGQNDQSRDAPPTEVQQQDIRKRPRHPVPCERCIRLEREIRIKLAELSRLIEEIGRRRQLRRYERSNSIEDLESLSQETAENIRILQRSIAMLNDDKDERTPGGGITSRVDDVSLDSSEANRSDVMPRRQSRHTGPVSYSTKVIKKRKAKKVTKLREIFRESPQQDETEVGIESNSGGTPAKVNEVLELSSASDANSMSRGEQSASVENSREDCFDGRLTTSVYTSADVNSPTTEQPDSSHVASVNSEITPVAKETPGDDYQNKLETFAENLAKYIIFRAKLFIVLENPETRIPYLKNELAPPSGSHSTAAEHVTQMTSGSNVGGTTVVTHDRKTGESNVNRNESGVGPFTNTGLGDVGASGSPVGCSPSEIDPDIRERIKQVASIQARIEYNMRKIREKMAALKALKVAQEQTLHVDPDRACLTPVAASSRGVQNDSGSGSMPLESVRSPFSCSSELTNSACHLSGCESSCECDDSKRLQTQSELQSECLNCESLEETTENLSEETNPPDRFNESVAYFAESEKNDTNMLTSVTESEENVADVVQSVDECDRNLTDLSSSSVDKCEPDVTGMLPSPGSLEPGAIDMMTSADTCEQTVSDMVATVDGCEPDGTSVGRRDQNITTMVSSVDRSNGEVTEVAPDVEKPDGKENLTSSVDESDGTEMTIAPYVYESEGYMADVDIKMLESAEKLRQVMKALSLDESVTGQTSDAECSACTDESDGREHMTDNDEKVDIDTEHSTGSVVMQASEEPSLARSAGNVTHQNISHGVSEIPGISGNQYAMTSVTDEKINAMPCTDTQRQGSQDDDDGGGGGGGTSINKEDVHDNRCGNDVIGDDNKCDSNRLEDTTCKSAGCKGNHCDDNSACMIGSEQQEDIHPVTDLTVACHESIADCRPAADEDPITGQETNQGEDPITDSETTANIQPMRAQESTSRGKDVQPIISHVSNKQPMANEQHSHLRTDVEKMKKILDFLDVYKFETASDNIDDVSSVASSDVSDTSVSTIIHVPVRKRASSGPKHDHQTASSSEQTHAHDSKEEQLRVSSPSQESRSDALPTSLVSDNQETDLKCNTSNHAPSLHDRGNCVSRAALQVRKETSLPCYVSHVSSFGNSVTPVIPEGIMLPGQYGRCQRPNVRCIPLSKTYETRIYRKTKSAEMVNTVKQALPQPVISDDRCNVRPARVKHSDEGRRNMSAGTNKDNEDTAENGSHVNTAASTERDKRNKLLDYANSKEGCLENQRQGFTSLGELLGDGKRSNSRDVAKGNAEAQYSMILHKSQSCDAIRTENSVAHFERAVCLSDSVLLSDDWTSRKSGPVVHSCVACLGDETSGKPTARTGDRQLAMQDFVPRFEHHHVVGGTGRPSSELPRTTCSCLLSVVLLERRWSAADLDAIKHSMDRGPDAIQSKVAREIRDTKDTDDENSLVRTAEPKPDFSAYVNYYAPYFEARKSRLPNRRSQIRVSPDPCITSTNRRRSLSLSPARSRHRSNKQVKIKKYPI